MGTGRGSTTAADLVAEADRVAARYAFRVLAPTDTRVAGTRIAIVRLADGTIAEAWVLWDQLGLLRQLGLVPAPPQPKR